MEHLSWTRSAGSKSASERAKWITNQAQILFSAYRRVDFADPDAFVTQLGVVLERYPDHVVRDVTDPRTGIQRRHKFPPSIAEVVEACEEEVRRLAKIAEWRSWKAAEPRPRRGSPQRYNLFVGRGRPGYDAMVEQGRTADREDYSFVNAGGVIEQGGSDGIPGIWVPLTWWDQHKSAAAKTGFRPFTKEELERIYRRDEKSPGARQDGRCTGAETEI